MNRPLVAIAVLSLVAVGGPALAAAEPKHGACKAPAGAVVLKAGAKPVETVAPTPVGAVGSAQEEAGVFYVDLQGKPQSTKGKVTLTLSWSNPVSDYDLVVNGENAASIDNPEVAAVKVSHCRPVQVSVEVFAGVPVDELTLSAKGS